MLDRNSPTNSHLFGLPQATKVATRVRSKTEKASRFIRVIMPLSWGLGSLEALPLRLCTLLLYSDSLEKSNNAGAISLLFSKRVS